MIFAIILPIAVPILAGVCLFGALRPGPTARNLLLATTVLLLVFWLWYLAVIIVGI